MTCNASTTSPLRRFRRFVMVNAADENARSLDTDEAIMARKSRAIAVHTGPYLVAFSLR
jgi:hypothetical protein